MDRIGPRRPFRHFIREWMDKKAVNQERLAGRLEIEASTVSKLLNGRMRMSDVWLSRIAWALNVDVSDLFLDPDAPSPADLLAGLDEEQKSTVLNLIDMLRRTG